jgi:alpha/beta superfamily hydrolase
MKSILTKILPAILLVLSTALNAQTSDTLILRDLVWDKNSPAGSKEIFIPSGNSQIAGLFYKANGSGKHPTLLLLHGYPGNERNLDLAQVVRAHGWNVIYFNYRGAWGSQGQFSFTNAIEDVRNVVAFCKANSDSLKIDASNIVLFGHSMGGFVCLKALQQLPEIKKGFALSTWNIGGDFKNITTETQLDAVLNNKSFDGKYFVLNTPVKEIFLPVVKNNAFYDLRNDSTALAGKQIIMLDEHNQNKDIAETIRKSNKTYFEYEVWQTDHSFTNKRVSLMKKVLAFLDK